MRLLLLFLLVFFADAAYAAEGATRDIIIWPFHDGVHDDESDRVANDVRERLSAVPSYHVITPEIVSDVVAYHPQHTEDITAALVPIRERIERGREAYFRFQYAEAQAELDHAIRELTDIYAADAAAGPLLVEALIAAAVVTRVKGDEAEARKDVAGAFHINPLFALSPHDFPPAVIHLLEEERSAYREKVGTLSITTDPEVAEVYVNGIYHGVTPLTLPDLPEGDYRVKIEANRYEPVERQVAIAVSQTSAVQERLRWRGSAKASQHTMKDERRQQISFGLHLAEVLKASRVVLVDVDTASRSTMLLQGRIVDRDLQAGMVPVSIKADEANPRAADEAFATKLLAALDQDLRADPLQLVDPAGSGDVRLMTTKRRRIAAPTYIWGGIGTAVFGALIGGIVAAMDGGDAPRTGAVRVQFQ